MIDAGCGTVCRGSAWRKNSGNMNRILTIGMHMTAAHEQTRRLADGVLQYTAGYADLKVADFCFMGADPILTEPPAWTGKADGAVASISRLPGIMPWLRSGGVPVVAVGADLQNE